MGVASGRPKLESLSEEQTQRRGVTSGRPKLESVSEKQTRWQPQDNFWGSWKCQKLEKKEPKEKGATERLRHGGRPKRERRGPKQEGRRGEATDRQKYERRPKRGGRPKRERRQNHEKQAPKQGDCLLEGQERAKDRQTHERQGLDPRRGCAHVPQSQGKRTHERRPKRLRPRAEGRRGASDRQKEWGESESRPRRGAKRPESRPGRERLELESYQRESIEG